MSPIEFRAIRGGAQLGANAYLIEAHGVSVLLDAGARQGRRPVWVDQLDEPALCWLSHAHWDHLGALPRLRQRFPTAACLASRTTRRLAEVSLTLSGVEDARAAALASQLQSVPLRQYFSLSRFSDKPGAAKFRGMLFEAGHMPGAAMLLLEIDRGADRPFRLLYTGDFCLHDQPLTAGAMVPGTGEGFPIDVLVMEGVLATNETCDAIDYDAQVERLEQSVSARRGGALVAVASLGEAGEVAAALAGSVARLALHSRLEPALRASGAHLEGMAFTDETGCKRTLDAGGVVIAPGDQLHPSTPAGRLVARVVPRADAQIVLLNRTHRGSLAGALRRASAGQRVAVGRRQVQLAASVEHFVLPNHAPRWQLTRLATAVDAQRTLLVHGHKSQLYTLRRAIKKAGYAGRIDVPENGAPIPLDTASG